MATPLPLNAASFSLDELLAATGGRLVQGSAPRVTHVSTNTRDMRPGAVFVALQGQAHDGHQHIGAAAAAGALVAIVEREVGPCGLAVIRVGSTLKALGDLARAHVKRWHLAPGRTLIAITGSAGKTTTRVAMTALVESLFPGELLATRGNLNNRIGVPMVLFSLGEAHRIAVLELGTSEPGEIAELCRIARPDVGILTLIAAAHLEDLGSIEGVAEEKAALFVSLPATGIAVGNAGDVRVRRAMEATPCAQRASYGRHESAAVRLVGRSPLGMTNSEVVITRRDGRRSVFRTPLVGEAGALACAAAVAAVEATFGFALDSEQLTECFSQVKFDHQAQRLVPHLFPNGLAAIDDAYNANPASMAASIEAAAEMAMSMGRRLILVLGEMGELGKESASYHAELGRIAAASGAALILAVGGGESWRIAEQAVREGVAAQYRETVDEAASALTKLVQPNDLLLVKASRAVGANRILKSLASR